MEKFAVSSRPLEGRFANVLATRQKFIAVQLPPSVHGCFAELLHSWATKRKATFLSSNEIVATHVCGEGEDIPFNATSEERVLSLHLHRQGEGTV